MLNDRKRSTIHQIFSNFTIFQKNQKYTIRTSLILMLCLNAFLLPHFPKCLRAHIIYTAQQLQTPHTKLTWCTPSNKQGMKNNFIRYIWYTVCILYIYVLKHISTQFTGLKHCTLLNLMSLI